MSWDTFAYNWRSDTHSFSFPFFSEITFLHSSKIFLTLKLALLLPLVPETRAQPWSLVLEPQFSSVTFYTLTPLCFRSGLEMPNFGLQRHLAVRPFPRRTKRHFCCSVGYILQSLHGAVRTTETLVPYESGISSHHELTRITQCFGTSPEKASGKKRFGPGLGLACPVMNLAQDSIVHIRNIFTHHPPPDQHIGTLLDDQ